MCKEEVPIQPHASLLRYNRIPITVGCFLIWVTVGLVFDMLMLPGGMRLM